MPKIYTAEVFLSHCETAVSCVQRAERLRRVIESKVGGPPAARGAHLALAADFEELVVYALAIKDTPEERGLFLERHPSLEAAVVAFERAAKEFHGAVVHCPTESPRDWSKVKPLQAAADSLSKAIVDKFKTPPGPIKAKEYLKNWRDLLDGLGRKNNEEERRFVRSMNDRFQGPIIFSGQGAQPLVDKDKLLLWWDDLERRAEEAGQKRADSDATLQARYDSGRSETIRPEISGHDIKRRRKEEP